MGLTAAMAATLILHYQRPRPDLRGPATVSSPLPARGVSGVGPDKRLPNDADIDTVETSAVQNVSLSPAASASTKSRPSTSPGFVVVQPNQDLFRICLEGLGRYDERTLEAIRELNPELDDLNRIKVGQKIRLPQSFARYHAPRAVAVDEQSLAMKGSDRE
jgi:hypothetical protein